MWALLHARPYISDPSRLTVTDEHGREALGFATPSVRREGYLEFEDVFRGGEGFIKERQRGYIHLLTGHAPVLDVGRPAQWTTIHSGVDFAPFEASRDSREAVRAGVAA